MSSGANTSRAGRARKGERRAVTAAPLPLGGHAQLAMDVAPRRAAPAFAGIAAGDVVLVATANGAATADVIEVDGEQLRVRGCETRRVDGRIEISNVAGHFAAHQGRRTCAGAGAEQLRLS